MFSFIRSRKLRKYTEGALRFIKGVYRPSDGQEPDAPIPSPAPEQTSNALPEAHVRYSSVAYSDFYSLPSSRTDRERRLAFILDSVQEKTFVEKLAEYIRGSGRTETEIYKAAQIDRRLFSRMMSDSAYRPSKDTAIAFAFALRLGEDDAADLLNRAGYAFSKSVRRDTAFHYFFRERIYDLTDINILLTNLGEKPLGC